MRVRVSIIVLALLNVTCGSTPPEAEEQPPELQGLFDNLPEPTVEDDAPPRLVLRDGPPVAAPDHVEVPFPPREAAPRDAPPPEDAPPLEVIDHQPRGEIDGVVGAIRVTFNQPMVPIAALSELRARDVPVRIHPQPPGRFRWLGTATVAFEPTGELHRMPGSTEFTVRVPAGTRSAIGGVLAADHVFRFGTPALHEIEMFPHSGASEVELRPLIGVRFNQAIDAARVAERIRLEGGAERPALVPIAEEERTAILSEHPILQRWEAERHVLLRPSAPLARGTRYSIVVPAGMRGAEGPRGTAGARTHFDTYGAFRYTSARCGYDNGPCPPTSHARLELTTTIAPDQDLETLIAIDPPVARMSPQSSGTAIYVRADFEAQTTYRITARAGLRDIHGQRLGADTTREIRTGDHEPSIRPGAGQFATLELDSARFYPVDVMNQRSVSARVASIDPDQLRAAILAVRRGWGPWSRPDPDPFQQIHSPARTQRLITRSPRNEEDRVGVPLGLPEGAPGMALVEITIPSPGSPGYREYAITQATDLGIVTAIDSFGATVRVTSLSTGQPAADAQVRIEQLHDEAARRPVVRTDAQGIARFDGPFSGDYYFTAQKGEDLAFALAAASGFDNPVAGSILTDRNPYRPGDTVHMSVFSRQRQARPDGRLRGWPADTTMRCIVRDAHYAERERFDFTLDAFGTASHDLTLPADGATGEWQIECPLRSHSLTGSFRVEEYRAPEIEVEVTAPRGDRFLGGRPAFVVESDYLFGAPAANMPVTWTFGREPTRYAPPGHDDFEFGDQTNMHWRPWIGPTVRNRYGRGRTIHVRDDSAREIIAGNVETPVPLDAEGRLRVAPRLVAPEGSVGAPFRFVLEALVTDPSRQAVAGRAELIAHPSALYVGLRNEHPFLTEDDAIRVRAIVTEVGGRVAAGKPIRVRAVERRSRLIHRQLPSGMWTFEWENDDREVGSCELTSAAEPVECRIDPQRSGSYVIEARTTDDRDRENVTAIAVWITGNDYVPNEQGEHIDVVADRDSYAAGETARLLVRAPFARGRGLLTIEKQGAIETRAIDLDGSLQVVEVPITDDHVPRMIVRVALARGRVSEEELRSMLEDAGPDAVRAAQEDVGRPAYGTGMVQLSVDAAPKTLTVEVRPERDVSDPGRPLNVDVNVRGPNGRPARAAVTIAVVDEGVLSLLGYETPNPVESLHPELGSSVNVDGVHRTVVRRRPMRELRAPQPDLVAASRTSMVESGQNFGFGGLGLRGTGRGGGGTGEGTIGLGNLGTIGHGGGNGTGSGYGRGVVVERSIRGAVAMPESADVAGGGVEGAIPDSARGVFATTAFYRAFVETDRDGHARVRIDLPDNLTTFRIMAVAIGTDDKSGSGEASVQVRKRLLLRAALPRFATLGDRFEASVVVHNETGETRDVTVGVRAAGLAIDGPSFQRVRMRSGEAREVHFDARVEAGSGRGKVQFAASAGDAADAVDVELPFAEPATAEAFATYGSTEGDAVRVPVSVPEDVISRWGRLEVSMSSSALNGLDDAADYLFDYPYECAEQHASRLVAAAALTEVLEGRDEEGQARARAQAESSIASLYRLQRGDGGFVFWPRSYQTELYTSAWVVYALLEAKDAGIAVDPTKLSAGLSFLMNRTRHPRRSLGERTDWVLHAAALYTYARSGRTPPNDLLTRVWGQREHLPLFAKAWLLGAIHEANEEDARGQELWRELQNAAVVSAGGAHFAESTVESARVLWHSERRTDAIVLAVMLAVDPEHALIEGTTRALIAARRNGRWHTTQENAWALSSLARYYRARESVPPDLEVSAWLGEQFLGTTRMRGRSGTVFDGSVPMEALREIGSGDLVIDTEGEGRMYYRIGMRYAPTDQNLPAQEQGFSITRSYEPVEDDADVRRARDGTWRIRAEATVRVRITVVIPDDRYDVAIDDPLPAGLEAVNMAFDTTATQRWSGALDEQRLDFGNFWALFAFEHREMRDDRVVAFARHAPAGVYDLTYLARATTIGRFIATPTHGEEMYAPEVFGRTATDTIVVERR
jgi:uncharacterized protein YfaS (alpha-2-macroglobulin family)